MDSKRGIFITFEGIDGCGKSTQIRLFEKYLVEKSKPYKLIREPGGTEIGEKIRDILLDKKNTGMYPETELLLFEASRAQIVKEVIKPSLESVIIVLCDRFYDSSLAYQVYARGLDIESIENLNNFATGGLDPDITFLFDLEPELAAGRLSSRIKENDRIDAEGLEFSRRVREGYLAIADKEKERFKILDASRGVKKISYEIIKIFEEVTGI